VNIVIPMAGLGARFAAAGYSLPKPFIDVGGSPMISRVMDNLRVQGAHYTVIVWKQDALNHPDILTQLEQAFPVQFLPIDCRTEGTAATLLFARHAINNSEPMIVANCDQLVDGGIEPMIADFRARELDGMIMAFEDSERNPKWSFLRLDQQGLVVETREKVPISSFATVGIYVFRRGADFVDAAIEMIVRNDRVNNEFYTCPVYNYLIDRGQRVGAFFIEQAAMHGLGTPEDLDAFLKAK
jgi:dTDP-glucose pyrophosphorylase